MRARTTRSGRRRRGFTLAELLLASTVAALTALGSAALINAVSNASTSTRDLRAQKNAGRSLLNRISSELRQARAIADVAADRIILWQADLNRDDRANEKEIVVIRWISASNQVVREGIPNGTETDAGAEVSFASLLDADAVTNALDQGGKTSTVIGAAIENFALHAYPDSGETRLVSVEFTVGAEGQTLYFTKATAIRAAADYLFDTRTSMPPATVDDRTRRKYYSRWTGFHDVKGTAAPVMTIEDND